MEQFEHSALSAYSYTGLQSWLRYVDYTFVVLHSDEIDNFLCHINVVDPNIKFIQINISGNRLFFLDYLVTIDTDHTLSATVFRNDTHTDQYLSFQSNHPLSQKHGVAKTLCHRSDNLMSKQDDMLSERKHLRQCLNQCGYKNSIIDHAINVDKRHNTKTATSVQKNKCYVTLP